MSLARNLANLVQALYVDPATGRLGVGTTSTLGNSLVNIALGLTVRNQSTTTGYFQTYNANAGSNLKTWRWGGNDSGALVFETVNDAYSSATGRMTLDASGNLGVGTASPTNFGSTYRAIEVAAPSGSGDGFVLVRHGDGTTLGQFRTSGSGVVEVGARSNHPLTFSTNNVERARIDSSGQFGIGITPSSGMLHVKGDWVSGHSTVKVQSTTAMASGGVAGYGIYDSNGTRQMYISADGTTLNWWGQANKPFVIAVNDAERARIDTSGNFYVGKTTTDITNYGINTQGAGQTIYVTSNNTYSLQLTRRNGIGAFQYFNYNGADVGIISTNGSATTYSTTSDYRLKEDVRPMTGALAKVAALKPCTYKWKADGSYSEGFIAHELAEVVPDAVTGEKDATRIERYEISPAVPATFDEEGNELTPAIEAEMGEREVPAYQGIDTSFLVATLTAAIQEQQAIIESLTQRVAALEA